MSIFGWTGLLLSLLFLLSLPLMLPRVETRVSETMQSASAALRTGASAFDEQLALFDRIDETLVRLHDFSAATDGSLASGTDLMDDMADFLSGPLDSTIEATETSLRSASEGAASIDALLRIIAAVPFFGGPDYNPAQPLDASLLQAADGLAPLRPALNKLQNDLRGFSGSTEGLQVELLRMDETLGQTGTQLVDLRAELVRVGIRLAEVADRLDSIQANLHLYAWVFGVAAGLVSIWAALLNLLLIREAGRMLTPQLLEIES
ncbi:MAG: hypothetical protein P8X64_10530 [Anaerolineales bacterium]